MPREITLRIVGDTATKSRRRAGVVGEGNVTSLICTFDSGWDGYAKSLTFWDAEYANPVKILLTEAVRTAERQYTVLIPAEPLAKAGACYLVVDGASESGRARTVTVEFDVDDAPVAEDAAMPGAVTPTQAEQLSAAITTVGSKADTATNTANEAKRIAEEAKEAAAGAKDSAGNALLVAEEAKELAQSAPEGKPGEKGDKGDRGEKGDKGDKGDPGYTPVRGVDYWTPTDIAEIKGYVDDAILGGAW